MAIPLPGQPGQAFLQGSEGGSNLMQRILNNQLARDQFGLQQQQFGLQEQLAPFQQELLEQQAKLASQKAGMYGFKQNFLNELLSKAHGANLMTSEQPSLNRGFVDESGGITPVIEQQQPQAQQSEKNLDLGKMIVEMAKDDPALAGAIKDMLNIDLYARSPESQANIDVDKAARKKQKEIEIEQKRDKTYLTNSEVDKIQNQITQLNQVLPGIKKLTEIDPRRFNWGSTESQKYFGQTLLSADKLAKALNLPNAEKLIEKTQALFKAGKLETDKEYKERMQEIYREIAGEGGKLFNVLESGKAQNPLEMFKQGIQENEKNNSNKGAVIGVINGTRYQVLPENIEKFLAAGGVINE